MIAVVSVSYARWGANGHPDGRPVDGNVGKGMERVREGRKRGEGQMYQSTRKSNEGPKRLWTLRKLLCSSMTRLLSLISPEKEEDVRRKNKVKSSKDQARLKKKEGNIKDERERRTHQQGLGRFLVRLATRWSRRVFPLWNESLRGGEGNIWSEIEQKMGGNIRKYQKIFFSFSLSLSLSLSFSLSLSLSPSLSIKAWPD